MITLLDTLIADGGFTYDPQAGALVELGSVAGYAIAVPGTERVVGNGSLTDHEDAAERFADAFTATVRAYDGQFLAGEWAVGGWYSPERDAYMVEISVIFRGSREAAVALGRARNQEAIFDLATGETIVTGGTGDAVR
jgi:hypothetical protein